MEVVLSTWLFFLILAMAAATVHRALRELRRQEHTTRAALLAQGQLEILLGRRGKDLKPATGSFPAPFEGYRWTLEVAQQPDDFLRLSLGVQGPAQAKVELVTIRRMEPRQVVFTSNRSGQLQVYRVQDDGTGMRCLTAPGRTQSQPAPAPDGRHLAVIEKVSGQSRIVLRELEGQSDRMLSEPGIEPAWSPSGRLLAYVAILAGYSRIVVVDLDSELKEVLTPGERHENSPVFSPDGRQLAFVTDGPDGSRQVGIMTVGGLGRRLLTEGEGWNVAPAWSPDGRRVVFMSNRDGNPEIYSVGRTGTDLRRLTADGGYDTAPRYSPDGRKIVFRRDSELWLMNSDGSKPRRLLRGRPLSQGVLDCDPVFLP